MKLCGWGAVLLCCISALQAQAGGERRRTVEEFRAVMRECRSVDEKASVLHHFAATSMDQPGAVPEIGRFLSGSASDPRFVLPLTAASALSRLRGNKTAAQSLAGALEVYRRTPYVQRRMVAALAAVGHESAVPVFDDLLRGSDVDLAVFAASAAADLPADLALDLLIRHWEWMEGRRAKAGEEAKKQYTRLGEAIYKVVRAVSEEQYPSMTEMHRWWARYGREWKGKTEEREKRRKPPAAEPPPLLLVELPFNERTGLSTSNQGLSAAMAAPAGILTKTRPQWSGESPPNGGGGSLDWGKEAVPGALDVPGSGEFLRNLKSFTVTGWVCARSAAEGPGGNRILSWLDRDGVEIVHRADGSLQVGVNRKAELSDARTESSLLPLADETVPMSIHNGWRFVAVTYDATAASGQLKIYVGTRDQDAALKVTRDVAAQKVGPRVAAGLSIGHAPVPLRLAQPGSMFRGLIDEVRVFGSTWDGSAALPLETLVKLQNRS